MEKHNWSQLATRLVVKYAEYFTLLGRGLLCGAAALGLPLFRQAGTAAKSCRSPLVSASGALALL
jgi:hypothetical protein